MRLHVTLHGRRLGHSHDSLQKLSSTKNPPGITLMENTSSKNWILTFLKCYVRENWEKIDKFWQNQRAHQRMDIYFCRPDTSWPSRKFVTPLNVARSKERWTKTFQKGIPFFFPISFELLGARHISHIHIIIKTAKFSLKENSSWLSNCIQVISIAFCSLSGLISPFVLNSAISWYLYWVSEYTSELEVEQS